jgi:hypothetical protein
MKVILLFMCGFFVGYFPGCRKPMEQTLVAPTPCPLLAQYALRVGLCGADLRREGTQWPQYVFDYAKAHGPALSPDEKAEFTAWQVK